MGNGGEDNDQCNYYRRNIFDSVGNCDSERLNCYSDDCVKGALGTSGQCGVTMNLITMAATCKVVKDATRMTSSVTSESFNRSDVIVLTRGNRG
jgi:hypothetical protein